MSSAPDQSPDADPIDVLVLGIGNVLWADEGFGIRAAEALHAQYTFPPNVRIMDGGTQGMFLLPYVQQATRLLVFDAIDFGLPPAEMRLIRDDDVPRYMGAKKVSMHQTGFQEVLASANLTDQSPVELALIGVQPVELDDYGGSLRPAVRSRLPDAVRLGIEVLADWGVKADKRQSAPAESDRLGPLELDMAPYERARSPVSDSD